MPSGNPGVPKFEGPAITVKGAVTDTCFEPDKVGEMGVAYLQVLPVNRRKVYLGRGA